MTDLLEGFDVWGEPEWIALIREQHEELRDLNAKHARRRIVLAITLRKRKEKQA